MNLKHLLLIFFILFCLSCSKTDEPVVIDYQYSAPTKYNDNLDTATLQSVGINFTPIGQMMDYINSVNDHEIHDILILRNNKLVFEQYFEGHSLNFSAPDLQGTVIQYNRLTDHYWASVTKSVTSVLVGVARQNGYIQDLTKKIVDYFPEYDTILTGEKANITVEHLLTMRVGLEYDEGTYLYTDPRSDTYKMMHSVDPIAFVLSKPIASTPGTQFHYNTGSTNVLAAIIAKESGKTFFNWANEYFFDAMGIQGGRWTMLPGGLPMASGGLYLRARELSKIGLLFLNGGMWQGKQFISADWINRSQQEYVGTGGYIPNTMYGYQWWIRHFTVKNKSQKCFFGAGWGDQYMFIFPDLQLIVIFNCGNFTNYAKISPFTLLENYVLKAID